MTRSPRAAAAAAALSLLAGCRGQAPQPNRPVVALVAPADRGGDDRVNISGLTPTALDALRSQHPSQSRWQELVRVDVLPPEGDQPREGMPAVEGAYAVSATSLEFTPAFPFEPGLRYRVLVDTSRLPGGPARQVTAIVGRPAQPSQAPLATVTAIAPGGDVLPENLLRVYIHFSAPMSRRGEQGHVRLLDEAGREVVDPFLPVEAELWSQDHTRYTLFFDPGRVKTGIRPNEEMGRALIEGRGYTLVVDADWRDASGRALAAPFRRRFRAGPAIEGALDPAQWTVAPPRAGSRDPLVVSFPHALDEGLLMRSLAVECPAGAAMRGAIALEGGGRQWRFVPEAPWARGACSLAILGILEDPAGNRIGRAFEIGERQAVKEVDRATVPFIIGP